MTVNPGIREGREFMDCRDCWKDNRHTRDTGCILADPLPPDDDCHRCGGTGCVACDARYLPVDGNRAKILAGRLRNLAGHLDADETLGGRITADDCREAADLLTEPEEMLPRDVEIDRLEDLICALWLYVGWRHVTEKLTTEQRELFADVIDRYHLRDFPADYVPTDRWWRDA